MSLYEPQGWQAPARQPSWEQPPPPSRSGASSTSQTHDTSAFATQFEEVDRAVDNLVKSGKFYPHGPRRESMPAANGGPGRSFDHGPRFHGGRHSVSENAPARTGSASNVQNFYASQRFQGRSTEADPMMQVKRRMAAQRERELRNYHQEQQYNRKGVLAEMASNKSERSMSPSTLSEEGRRDLIARQHRALYGAEAPGFAGPPGHFADDTNSRDQAGSIPTTSAGGGRGQSPRGIDPFGGSGQQSDGSGQGPNTGDRKVGSPSGQQGQGTSSPSVEDPGHTRQLSKATTAPLAGGMGPIGSRPAGQHVPVQSLNKRTTSPLPSSLGYGFGGNEQNNERSQSSNSNANNTKESQNASIGGWGAGSGVWGSNKIGATSVWG